MRKTIKLALLMAATVVVTRSWGAWDDPPLANSVQGAANSLSLNFTAPGVHQQIALFVINSNDASGFHIQFTFANKGYFRVGTRQFPMSNVVVNPVGGTLGTGLTPPANTPLTIDAGTGIATWSPAGTPTGATDSYLIEIDADWANQSANLAGYYYENISAVIVSGP